LGRRGPCAAHARSARLIELPVETLDPAALKARIAAIGGEGRPSKAQ
jgi:hypothetical protein